MNRREVLAAGAMMAAATLVRAGDPAAGALITRPIPSSSEPLPVVGLGTSGPFEVEAASAAGGPLPAVLQGFFAAGGRLIDTSPMYSSAEAVLGELLTPAMHEHAFLATKVWTHGEREGIEQMQRSAQLLRAGKLDLIQVHNLTDLDVQLRTLRAWKEAGRVRYIGVTHYTVGAYPQLIRVLERERLDFIQFNYSPVTREAEKRLLPLAAARGTAVLVNRPFEDGALFARARGKTLPGWAAELDAASWGQLALKFIVGHAAVTCVIPATGKLAHLEDNLGGGRGRLPDAGQREQIARLFS